MLFSRSQSQGCQCGQCQSNQQGRGRMPAMQPPPQRPGGQSRQQVQGRHQMQSRQQMPAYQPQRQQTPQQMHPQMSMQPQGQGQQGNVPYSDPAVRFEPIPEGLIPPGMSLPTTAEAPVKSSVDNLKTFMQGEVNSLAFYEKLSNISQSHKDKVLELIQHKKNGNPLLLQANPDEEIKVDEVDDFASGISHALLEESRQLREMTKIKDGSISPALLANKIADIAHLMSLQ